MNNAIVMKIVFLGERIAANKTTRKGFSNLLSFCWWCSSLSGRIIKPIKGVNTTATNHEAIRAIAITANKENTYSPAELLAKPTGIKATTVTKVPVSIGKVVEV